MTTRIAMWSGPRTVSTALMRSWGNRPDTAVWDEPLYAHYLEQTDRDHPGAREVIAHHEADPDKVIAGLIGPVPDGKSIFYQKHMAHHMLPDVDRSWLDQVTNCFLIRDPREMLASLAKHVPEPTIEDTGLPQQVAIFDRARRGGGKPPVLDARDLLEDPRRRLERLCKAVGVPFTDTMLSWPPGPRDTDGVWGKYWYDAVESSTSFKPFKPKTDPLPKQLEELCERCMVHYEALAAYRLT